MGQGKKEVISGPREKEGYKLAKGKEVMSGPRERVGYEWAKGKMRL